MTYAENHRRRPGFRGRRHAGARRTDRGSDQGVQVRRLGDAYFDQEFGEELDRLFTEKFDLLLGRKTYEIFAAYWPYYDEDAPRTTTRTLLRLLRSTHVHSVASILGTYDMLIAATLTETTFRFTRRVSRAWPALH